MRKDKKQVIGEEIGDEAIKAYLWFPLPCPRPL